MQFKIGKINFLIWKDKEDKGGRPKSKVDVDAIIRLHEQGNSIRCIGKRFSISKSTVSNILHEPSKYR